VAALGLTAVEVWLGHWPGPPEQATSALADRGLRAVAVSAGGFYEQDGASPEQALELVRAVAAPSLVACVEPSRLPAIAALLPPDVTLCVENHWDQPLATPRQLVRALAPEASVGACLDTGHALAVGVRPERFVRDLQGRLRHVHLKDAQAPNPVERLAGRRLRRRFLPRPQAVRPGHGGLDLESFAAALAECGYDGAITVEYEGAEPASALAELVARWREVDPRRLAAQP
jgi:sugar phosphate isomerase/epimerase